MPRLLPPPASPSGSGRARSWVWTVLAIVLIAVNLRAALTSVGPVVGEIQSDLGMSSAQVAALTSLPLVAFAVVSPLAPALVQRIGLENTLAAAVLVLAGGITVRSASPDAAVWVGTTVVGVAIAVLNVALPSLVKRDLPHHLGLVTGVYSALQSCLAAVAAGLAVPLAAQTVLGWRLSLGVWAVLALVGALGLVPLVLRAHRRRASRAAPAGSAPARVSRRWMWSNPVAWQVTLFLGLQSMQFYVLLTWMSSIEQAAGASPLTAGLHQAFLNFGGLAGSLACSVLLHRLADQRPVAVGGCSLMLVSIVGLLLAPQLGAVWSWSAGIACGTTLVLALSLFGLRTGDHRDAGALSGMAQSVGYAIAALGPTLLGLLHDVTGTWTLPLLVLSVVTVSQLAVGVLACRPVVLSPGPSAAGRGAGR